MEPVQFGHGPVKTASDLAAHEEMRARRAVIGATALVLPRTAPEFGVSRDQRGTPAPGFDQRALERRQALGEVLEQTGVCGLLPAVRVESVQRDLDRSD